MKYDIFISYRRDGGYETAKHLFDLLTRDGYTVSFDIDTLRNGDFDKTLLNRIDECTDFILVLDAHAFDRTLDPSFPKEKDWLYQELSYAMMKNKNIIPVMLSGFSFPDNLPDDIVKVQRKNGPKYDKYYFDEFYKKLKREFFDTPAPQKNESASNTINPASFVLKISVDETSMLYIDGKKIRKIRQGTTAEINTLKYGYKYDITLKNLAINMADFTIEYEVPDKKEGGEITVEFKKIREERKRIEEETRQKNIQQKEKQQIITDALRYICEDNYDWFDKICSNTVRVKHKGKYGYLNLQGFEIIPCVFDEATNFEGDFAYVSNDKKWGIINQSGELIIDFLCEQSSWINNGLTALFQNGKQKLVNLQIPQEQYGPYDEIILTEHRDRFLVKDQTGYYLINDCGAILGNTNFIEYDNYQANYHPTQNEKIVFPIIVSCQDTTKLWLIKLNSDSKSVPVYKGLMNKDGELLIPCIMESIKPIYLDYDYINFDYYDDYLKYGAFCFFEVKKNSTIGVFDIKTNQYSIPQIYRKLIKYKNQFYACNTMNKWGCVDINNDELIPFKYDDCRRIDYSLGNSIMYYLDDFDYSYFNSIGLFKLLSQETVTIERNDTYYSPLKQYKCCIIDCYSTMGEQHWLINHPFTYYNIYRHETFCSYSVTNKQELVDNINMIKDAYYNACCELYGKIEADNLVNLLVNCSIAEKIVPEFEKNVVMNDQQLLKKAIENKRDVIFYPKISIICSESCDTAFRHLTEEINRISEIFIQNGFVCEPKETIIVLLTNGIYKNETIDNKINTLIQNPKQLVFIGSRPWNDNNTNKFEHWVKNQIFFKTLNVINDKEQLILKIFAFMNEMGVESDNIYSIF